MRNIILTTAWLWVAVWSVAGYAQVPLSKPDTPLLTNGSVNAVAPLADGSVIIGGSFSHVNNVPRANLAKIKADGTLDPNWAPQTDDYVQALALDDFGNVFVGGNFKEVNGQTSRAFFAKLSASGTGALDPDWTLQVYGSVNTIVVDGNGDVMIGGIFSQVGTETRLRIAKLTGTGAGSVNATWNPSADGVVTVIALGPGGSVLVAGGFANIGGQPRQKLAMVSGLGAGQANLTWNPGVDDRIEALVTDYSTGNVYVAGYFEMIGGLPRKNVARLSGSTGVPDSWIPNVGGYTSDLRIGPDGMIYVVGDFVVVNTSFVGGIARLSPTTGATDHDWRPLGADSSVLAISFAPNGDAVIGGAFSTIKNVEAAGYVRIDSDAGAAVVGTASTDAPGYVQAVLHQADGGLVVGGSFWKAGSVRRNNLARFLPNGALDLNWNPSVEGGDFAAVYTVEEDAAGRVYIGGEYETIGGTPRSGLARYTWAGGVGTLDPNWNPQPVGTVAALAFAADGSVYAGGTFSEIGGQTRGNIAKLSGTGNGSAVIGWDGSANDSVFALALAASGDVYAGGAFTNIGGAILHYLARLSGTTGVANTTWDPESDDWVFDIAVGAADSVYVAGYFNEIKNETRNHIARIFAAGTGILYASFNPSADDPVRAIALDGQGNIYVGGDFDNIGGASRKRIAKLSDTTGQADPQWNPSIQGGTNNRRVFDLATSPDRLDVGGTFVGTGGRPRVCVASFSTEPGFLFSDSFE